MNDAIKEVLSKIKDIGKDNVEDVSSDKYFEIDDITKSDNQVCFVDGGQAEILKAVDFSLQFIRVSCVVMKDNKQTKSIVNEFFAIIKSVKKSGKDVYRAEFVKVKGDRIESIKVDPLDESLRVGKERSDISNIGNIARRLAELGMVEKMCMKLNKDDIIVLDGCFKKRFELEKDYIDRIKECSEKRDVCVCSLAKTSKRVGEMGYSMINSVYLRQPENKEKWYYDLKKEEGYNVCIVKLNNYTKRVFEFNIFDNSYNRIGYVLSMISDNSKDYAFPGYPYGLISVDKSARVTNEEKEYIKIKLEHMMGDMFEGINSSLNILNSHEVLDNIS